MAGAGPLVSLVLGIAAQALVVICAIVAVTTHAWYFYDIEAGAEAAAPNSTAAASRTYYGLRKTCTPDLSEPSCRNHAFVDGDDDDVGVVVVCGRRAAEARLDATFGLVVAGIVLTVSSVVFAGISFGVTGVPALRALALVSSSLAAACFATAVPLFIDTIENYYCGRPVCSHHGLSTCSASYGSSFVCACIALTFSLVAFVVLSVFAKLAATALHEAANDAAMAAKPNLPNNNNDAKKEALPAAVRDGAAAALESGGAVPEGEWVWDEASGLFWSKGNFLLYDAATTQYYDSVSEQWYDSASRTWYQKK